jgi:hypothetical protein
VVLGPENPNNLKVTKSPEPCTTCDRLENDGMMNLLLNYSAMKLQKGIHAELIGKRTTQVKGVAIHGYGQQLVALAVCITVLARESCNHGCNDEANPNGRKQKEIEPSDLPRRRCASKVRHR